VRHDNLLGTGARERREAPPERAVSSSSSSGQFTRRMGQAKTPPG
jgi:hypothetical protein